ncbi:hypothetical protein ACFSQ0_07345 [Mesonia sediminis]|uniref:Uncharacterized protein n=1 Tax=Mesonia sediminis TaxID=1703946 RepID=A0ABW5SDG4_9FLAO
MKNQKLNLSLILLGIVLFFGCSRDEVLNNEVKSLEKNGQLKDVNRSKTSEEYEMQTNSTEGWYFDIINSNNATAEFNALSNEEKANFWVIKYNIFEENSELSDEQMQYLNILSSFVHDAHLNQNYNEYEFNVLNKHILAVFEPNQVIDLIYYLDTPSLGVEPNACFWCNEIVDPGPCEIKERPQGGYYLARNATVKKYRFGIAMGGGSVEVPCTWQEWVAEG